MPAGGAHRICHAPDHCARRQITPASCSRGSAQPKRGGRGRLRRRPRWREMCVGAALRRRAGDDGHFFAWEPASALPRDATDLPGQAATAMARFERSIDGPMSPLQRRPSRTDCPAQHGGAERPQLTDSQLPALRDRLARAVLRAARRLRVRIRLACSSSPRSRDLTFDMSGGPKGAQRPLGRPLDGGVRRLQDTERFGAHCPTDR